jgi:hypothetical protein
VHSGFFFIACTLKDKIDKLCMHSKPKRGNVWLHASLVDQVKGHTVRSKRNKWLHATGRCGHGDWMLDMHDWSQ